MEQFKNLFVWGEKKAPEEIKVQTGVSDLLTIDVDNHSYTLLMLSGKYSLDGLLDMINEQLELSDANIVVNKSRVEGERKDVLVIDAYDNGHEVVSVGGGLSNRVFGDILTTNHPYKPNYVLERIEEIKGEVANNA